MRYEIATRKRRPALQPVPGAGGRWAERKREPPLFRHVMACVEPSPDAERVLGQAATLVEAGGGRLTALRVLSSEPSAAQTTPAAADPVEWELARREALGWLRELAGAIGAPTAINTVVVNGLPARSICRKAHEAHVDLLVLGASANSSPAASALGTTARQVAEAHPGSVLIVRRPGRNGSVEGTPARRVLALVDGSPQAEAASRLAMEIARRRRAELVLLHALPELLPALAGPPEPEDDLLFGRLRDRVERSARNRLQRIRTTIPAGVPACRVRLLEGEEPRRALARAIREEKGELVVLAARGLNSDPHMPIGSTAAYVLDRAETPVLLHRVPAPADRRHAARAPRAPGAVHAGR